MEDYTENVLWGVTISLLCGIGTLIGYGYGRNSGNRIRDVENVQSGYVTPKDIRVESRDLNGDGQLETLIKIKEKSYLLLEREGKPAVLEYNIVPSYEVGPK